jgi:hypothetical protein
MNNFSGCSIAKSVDVRDSIPMHSRSIFPNPARFSFTESSSPAAVHPMFHTLRHCLKMCNHTIAKRALKHRAPIQSLKKWQQEKPESLVKRVYRQAGLDR